MATLGHTGYGVYNIKGSILIVSPSRTAVLTEDVIPYELVALLNSAEEVDEWIDYKINWSIILYGSSFSSDLEEGV